MPVAIAAVCLLVVGVLAAAGRGSPASTSGDTSALPIPVVSADRGCAEFAAFWDSGSGIRIPAEIIEGFTNCRRSGDGGWFVPRGSDDPRWAAAPIVERQRQVTGDQRAAIEGQIAELNALITPGLAKQMAQIHSDEPHAVTGFITDGQQLGPTRTRYARIANAVVMDPANIELASYVSWLMQRRIFSFNDFRNTCLSQPQFTYLHTACSGLEDSLSIRYIPWPWDLAEATNLDGYLATLAPPVAANPDPEA